MSESRTPIDPGPVAVGTWSGGRFMHFGEPLDDDAMIALITPDEAIRTVITADVYGAGEADAMLGRAIAGRVREEVCIVGAVGHDFYTGERDGSKGFPRFTDPRLRDASAYADYLRMATERSLERCGIANFDLLLLHNPDRIGYTSEAVWSGMAALRDAGLTRMIGLAPGPANGFTLDVIDCLERFGSLIDWAMIILNPLEPWPGELCLGAAAANDVKVITRVVDYGGLFFDELRPDQQLAPKDHRSFRPAGWIEAGTDRLESLRPIAQRAGLTMIQLACQWNLAHDPVACVAPTLIQEVGPSARSVFDKRAELAALPSEIRLTGAEVQAIRSLGDNTGSMALKGASPQHAGDEQPDRWGMDERLEVVARRWSIEPRRDLTPEGGGVSAPLTGGCGCDAVRFEVTGPLTPAFYCHCVRCQRRTGTGSSLNARVASESFRIVAGEDRLRAWKPEGGAEKWFCGDCGSALFSLNPADPSRVGVRLGALHSDPGIRPAAHQFVAYAADWEPIPDDGLPRYPERVPPS